MRRIPALALTATLLLTTGLTGCVTSQSCVSWTDFDTPQDAAADATAVVLGTVTGRDGTQSLLGVDAHVWTVEVDEWITGEGDERIRVASTPETCTGGSTYPGGDPLDTSEPVILFLYEDAGTLRLTTPMRGVIPAPEDGVVPLEWPAAD